MAETAMKQTPAAEADTVLVATGLHRPNEGEELAELVGDPWVLDAVEVDAGGAEHVELAGLDDLEPDGR